MTIILPEESKIIVEEPSSIRAVIAYSVVDPTDRDVVQLEWNPFKTIAEYLDGLPDDGSWHVSLATEARVLEREEWDVTTLNEDDTLIVVRVPQGKGLGNILRIVAMIVVAVVAVWVFGPGGLAGLEGLYAAGAVAAATAVGGVLVNAMIPVTNGKNPGLGDSQDSTSSSYGLDGPKSTAKEGVPVPIIYGLYRTGGNRVNYYVVNSADGLTQDLYMQFVVSEGAVDSFSDIEINEQPITNFRDYQVEYRHGDYEQNSIPWFNNTITPYNDGRTITTTDLLYDTQDDIDRFRVDLVFPRGLYEQDTKSGSRSARTVGISARLVNLATEVVYEITGKSWINSALTGNTTVEQGSGVRVTFRAHSNTSSEVSSEPYAGNIQLTNSGGGTPYEEVKSGTIQKGFLSSAEGIAEWGPGTDTFVVEHHFGEMGAITINSPFEIVDVSVLANGAIQITKNERAAFRVSLESDPLPRGKYRLYIKRHEPASTSDYVSDDVVLAGVNEIIAEDVSLRRSANIGLKIRLSEQLNSEPNFTVLVKGRKVNIYDRNGNVSEYRWSDNPADIALDILLSADWLKSMSVSRIDFPQFVKWREFCEVNNLKFNGVFDYTSNVWDVLTTVMRVGRAGPIITGMKWSVAIEGPDVPVMMFSNKNIIKDSFENFWTGKTDRANNVEVQYQDKDNGYKQQSVFAINDESLNRGDALVPATINLLGVTSREQAQKEADLHLAMNKYITQSCRFSCHVDALGCTVGDIVYVQHEMTKWGFGDRVASKSGNNISLYGLIESPQVGDWRILCIKSALKYGDASVVSASGRFIVLNWNNTSKISRFVVDGREYSVIDQSINSNNYTVLTADESIVASSGQTAALWGQNVMFEGSIAQPATTTRDIVLTGWTHSVAIEPGDHVLIGRINKFKKPFRITKISVDSDFIRKIEAVEYIAGVYDPFTELDDNNYSELPTLPLQVDNVRTELYNEAVQGGGFRYFGKVVWDLPLNDPRIHAGSKVYVALNSEPFVHYETAEGGKNYSAFEGKVGDVVKFKVVAFDATGRSANFDAAPVAVITLGANLRRPDGVIGLTATGGIRLISVRWEIPNDPEIQRFEIWENDNSNILTAYIVDSGYKSYFVRGDLMPLETRYYWIRSVSYSGAYSDFIGPVNATTSRLIADDIQDGILNTAKFASSIAPIGLVDSIPTSPGYPNQVIFNKTDGKLYRFYNGAWTSEVPAIDVSGEFTEEQLALIDLAKLSGQITETQIEDNAISTPKLAAGVVTAEKIGAGAIVAEKLAIGSPNNSIWNAGFYTGMQGWTMFSNKMGQAFATLEDTSTGMSRGGRNVYSGISGVAFAGDYIDLIWNPDGDSTRVYAVTPGQRVQASMYAQAHGMYAQVVIDYFDANGNWVGNGDNIWSVGGWEGDGIIKATGGPARTSGLATFTRVGKISTAPANAAYATFKANAYVVSGSVSNPSFYITHCMLGRAFPQQIAIDEFVYGGMTTIDGGLIKANTIVADLIAANAITADKLSANSVIAGKIAAGAVRATEIAAGEIRATHLASETIITQHAQIGNAVINSAHIEDLSVGTLKVANGAITTTSYATRGDTVGGGGSGDPMQNVLEFTVNVPETRDGFLIANYIMSYSGGAGGSYIHFTDILVNGVTVAHGEGGVIAVYGTLASGITLNPGVNTIQMWWRGVGSMALQSRGIVVMVRAK